MLKHGKTTSAKVPMTQRKNRRNSSKDVQSRKMTTGNGIKAVMVAAAFLVGGAFTRKNAVDVNIRTLIDHSTPAER